MAEPKPIRVVHIVGVTSEVYANLLADLRAGRPAYIVDRFGKRTTCELRNGQSIYEIESGRAVHSLDAYPENLRTMSTWGELTKRYGPPVSRDGAFSMFAVEDGNVAIYYAGDDQIIFRGRPSELLSLNIPK